MGNEKTKESSNVNWYETWMKQSKIFFELANQNLSELLKQNAKATPEAYAKLANQWLENLRKQWDLSQAADERSADASYWKAMNKIYQEASDLLFAQWMKRYEDKNPVMNVQELYEMWLRCCQEIHERSLQSKSYQNAYGEFMNSAFKFWKGFTP